MMGHASLVTGGESFPTCTPPRLLPPKGTLDDLVVRLEENGQYIPAKRIRTGKGTELETVWAWVRNGQGQRTGCEVVQELVGQQKRSGQEALCSMWVLRKVGIAERQKSGNM